MKKGESVEFKLSNIQEQNNKIAHHFRYDFLINKVHKLYKLYFVNYHNNYDIFDQLIIYYNSYLVDILVL